MSKKISRVITAAKEKEQPDFNTGQTTRQELVLIDFGAALFRYHTALLETCRARQGTGAEWKLALNDFETKELELDRAWAVVKAQGYATKAAAYADFVELCYEGENKHD